MHFLGSKFRLLNVRKLGPKQAIVNAGKSSALDNARESASVPTRLFLETITAK